MQRKWRGGGQRLGDARSEMRQRQLRTGWRRSETKGVFPVYIRENSFIPNLVPWTSYSFVNATSCFSRSASPTREPRASVTLRFHEGSFENVELNVKDGRKWAPAKSLCISNDDNSSVFDSGGLPGKRRLALRLCGGESNRRTLFRKRKAAWIRFFIHYYFFSIATSSEAYERTERERNIMRADKRIQLQYIGVSFILIRWSLWELAVQTSRLITR